MAIAAAASPASTSTPGKSVTTIDTVTSQDGTTIAYRQTGHGPGLIVLHGIMESAGSHSQLADALADTFTVYLPDRRGRGKSGSYGTDYSIQREVEDLDALLTRTGAQYVMGVSMGAVITLQAALTLPAIHKAAIFDPPLIVNGSVPTDFVARYDREIAQGDIIAALVTAMQGSRMGPAIFNQMPRWMLRLLTGLMVRGEERQAQADDVTMRTLAPTLHYDFQLALELEGKQDTFAAIPAELLLLGGSASPAYMKTALDTLQQLLPAARRIEFAGLGHGATGNTNRGGKPQQVAPVLRQFFA